MSTTIRSFGVLAGFALVLCAFAALAEDWPQWRGAHRDAKVEGFVAPKTWPKELAKKWTAAVGTGVSSPVLVGNRIYAFGRIGGAEVTTCLDAAKGDVIWQDKHTTAAVGGAASGYGGPRATPAVAGGKVYTLGVNGTVSCLDAESGSVVWRKETGDSPQFSTSMSPLVAEGKCVVFLKSLVAFDAATGDIKWKGPSGTPYGSPVLMTADGITQIVTPTAQSLDGVNLADGKVLWQTALPKGGYTVNYSTPIVDGQTVIYVAPGGRGGAGSSFAYKIEKDGDAFKAKELWKGSASYQYNTPVLKDGALFGLSPTKTFYCQDAKTGQILWTDETPRGEAGGVVSAGSVILAVTGPAPAGGVGGGGKGKGMGGKGGEKATGDSMLVAFEPDRAGYKELAKYKLTPGPGLAYPIIAGNRVYVKGNSDVTLFTID
jgi:outer membrane protein assembly factor BamB